ncbi:MAG: ABC transporter ATP-binding protein, partial [Oscillospiraceae bacterium]|nr:ABC transporter ATP-binding protein [Oscillospiraceae bacterium]
MAENRRGPGHGPGGPGVPRGGFQKPKNMGKTIFTLLRYVGKSSWLLAVVAVCLLLNTLCTVGGSYMLKPLINECIVPGDYARLARTLVLMAGIYLCAAALSYTYSRIMVHISQTATHAIRRDLFAKMQRLPLSYFDTHTHGELMSRYTNDIDTLNEILQNG